MKIKWIGILLSLCCLPGWAQTGWKNPTEISADVEENEPGSGVKAYHIVQSGTDFAIRTTQGINGLLNGVPRIEAITSKGVFTWLEGKENYALQLSFPSQLNATDFFSRPRFSRADLEFNVKGIEKALNKRVLVGKSEKIAGRDCLVLNIPDRPDSLGTDFQKIWIDRETGLTMKIQDYFSGKLSYERGITKVQFELAANDKVAPSKESVIIRGIVSIETLLRVPEPRPREELKADIAKINSSAQNTPPWAKVVSPSSAFGYAQTNFRESQINRVSGSNSGNQSGSNGGSNRRQNQLAEEGQARQIVMFRTGNGGEAQMFQIQIEGNPNGGDVVMTTTTGVPATFSGSVNPDKVASGTSGTSTSQAPTSTLTAKTDFVDPRTGETVTLIQAKNRPAEGAIGPIMLGQPTKVDDQRISMAKSYSITTPFKLNILVWQRGDVSNALASTRLTVEELVNLAVTLK